MTRMGPMCLVCVHHVVLVIMLHKKFKETCQYTWRMTTVVDKCCCVWTMRVFSVFVLFVSVSKLVSDI